MQKLLRRLFPWQIRWKGVLLESALFLAAYIAWAIFRSPQSHGRLFIGSLAVLVPGVAAVLLVFRFLPQLPAASRPAWRFLGWGLACWSLGNLVRSIYEGAGGITCADLFAGRCVQLPGLPAAFPGPGALPVREPLCALALPFPAGCDHFGGRGGHAGRADAGPAGPRLCRRLPSPRWSTRLRI